MSPERSQLQIYQPHSGTVRISGRTPPASAARHARDTLRGEANRFTDFLFIGANAGQQAAKAAGLLAQFIHEQTEGTIAVAYFLHRYLVRLEPKKENPPVHDGVKMVEGYVWRAMLINTETLNSREFYDYREPFPKSGPDTEREP